MKNFDKIFFDILKEENIINNLKTEIINIEDFYCTKNDNIVANQNYTVSPYSLIINYAKEELLKINNVFVKFMLKIMIEILSLIFKLNNIDKNIFINNYLLSTNFFSKKWENIDINEIENKLKNFYPKHSFIIRSINKKLNPNLFKNLKDNNWILIVTRQIYIFSDWENVIKTSNYKYDIKLLNDTKYIFKEPKTDEDFKDCQKYYEKLYIKKYSKENLQFNHKWFKMMYENNLIHLRLLFDTINNKNVGVVGMVGTDNIITAPIVGYDTSINKNQHLYKRILIYTIEYSRINNFIFNCSSGAPEFKKLRGAEAYIEYSFVKSNKKFLWKILSFLSNNIYKNLLRKYKL